MRATLVAAILLVASPTALAQTVRPNSQAGSRGPTAPTPQAGQDGRRFEEFKRNLLAHIAGRVARMQQLQSCVQAATSREQMKVSPPRPEGTGYSPGE